MKQNNRCNYADSDLDNGYHLLHNRSYQHKGGYGVFGYINGIGVGIPFIFTHSR